MHTQCKPKDSTVWQHSPALPQEQRGMLTLVAVINTANSCSKRAVSGLRTTRAAALPMQGQQMAASAMAQQHVMCVYMPCWAFYSVRVDDATELKRQPLLLCHKSLACAAATPQLQPPSFCGRAVVSYKPYSPPLNASQTQSGNTACSATGVGGGQLVKIA